MSLRRATAGLAALFSLWPVLNVAQAGSDLSVGGLVKFADSYGTTAGGEFTVLKGPSYSGSDSFQTFCVQTSENINFGGIFKVGNISTASVVLTPHILEPATAFLYTKFRDETLPGYDFANSTPGSRAAAADMLQAAIWKLQGQANGAMNAYYHYALDAVDLDSTVRAGNTYGDANGWNNGGNGSVRIANMLFSNASGANLGNAQDQLILVPTPTASYAGAGLLGGLACLGVLNKRRSSRSEIQ